MRRATSRAAAPAEAAGAEPPRAAPLPAALGRPGAAPLPAALGRPGAAPLPAALGRPGADWAREHLEVDIVGWLTTVAPGGELQSSVISFLRDGADIVFYSQPDTPKVRNLEHSPEVSFHLQSDQYGDHWLIVEGTAGIDPTIAPMDRNAAYTAKYREAHAHWGLDFTDTARRFSAPIRIRPTRVRAG